MKNHIISHNNSMYHYYADSAIYRRLIKNGFFAPPLLIKKDSDCDFGIWCEGENVHIISNDKNNNIIYTHINSAQINHYTILGNKQNVKVADFSLTKTGGIFNMFYTATIDKEIFLVHCVLGNNAMPYIISKISDRNYFIHANRIYFSNESGTLGYCDFSDSKPDSFVPLFKDSASPYICGTGENRHMVWLCKENIMLDGVAIMADKNAEAPIIVNSESVMWRSNNIVYYLPICDIGATQASPMRFVSSGKMPELFCIHKNGEWHYFYGIASDKGVNLFGNSDCFEKPFVKKNNELDRIKIYLDEIQSAVNEIRKYIGLKS